MRRRQCGFDVDPICTAGEIPTDWDGVWSPGFAGCETDPGSCAFATTYVHNWSVTTTGTGYTFTFQIQDPVTGIWSNIGTASPDVGDGSFNSGDIAIPPCGAARVWLTATDASGEYYFGGDYWVLGTNDNCTGAMEAAFEAVPDY